MDQGSYSKLNSPFFPLIIFCCDFFFFVALKCEFFYWQICKILWDCDNGVIRCISYGSHCWSYGSNNWSSHGSRTFSYDCVHRLWRLLCQCWKHSCHLQMDSSSLSHKMVILWTKRFLKTWRLWKGKYFSHFIFLLVIFLLFCISGLFRGFA